MLCAKFGRSWSSGSEDLESSLPNDALCHVWLRMAPWISGRKLYVINVFSPIFTNGKGLGLLFEQIWVPFIQRRFVPSLIENGQTDKWQTTGDQTRGPLPLRSPEYQRLYTDFLSEGLIFIYQKPHHRINENQPWYRKAAYYKLCLSDPRLGVKKKIF